MAATAESEKDQKSMAVNQNMCKNRWNYWVSMFSNSWKKAQRESVTRFLTIYFVLERYYLGLI